MKDRELPHTVYELVPAKMSDCTWAAFLDSDIIVPLYMPPSNEAISRLFDLLFMKKCVSKLKYGDHKAVVTQVLRIKPVTKDQRETIEKSAFSDSTKRLLLLAEENISRLMKERKLHVNRLNDDISNEERYASNKSQIEQLKLSFKKSLEELLVGVRSPYFSYNQYFLEVASNDMSINAIGYSQPLLELYYGAADQDPLEHLPFLYTFQGYQAVLSSKVYRRFVRQPQEPVRGTIATFDGYQLDFQAKLLSIHVGPTQSLYHKAVGVTVLEFAYQDLIELKSHRERQRQLGIRTSFEPEPELKKPTRVCRKSYIRISKKHK